MGLVLNDVPRKQEIHFNKSMLIFVTTLFFITILLWPLNKNVQSPGGGGEYSMFISETVLLLSLGSKHVDVGAD